MSPGRATWWGRAPAAARLRARRFRRMGSSGAVLVLGPLVLGAAPAAFGSAAAAQTPAPAPCQNGARYADFDFWVGEWDVFQPDGRQAGTNRIERTERGCLVIERWTGAGGSTGTSMNFYDPARDRWRQLWVSMDGTVIEIEGGLRDGSMVLEGVLIAAGGGSQPFRGTWTPNEDGSVRQHFEISEDGGRTWATWFDGRYVRR